jgi:hypothetical protein
MIASGRSYIGEPFDGVTHPFTQLAVTGPRVGGGELAGDGAATGVGLALVATGVIGGDALGGGSSCPGVHAPSSTSTATTPARRSTAREDTPAGRGARSLRSLPGPRTLGA